MRIKNEYIRIKSGNKTFDLNNYIYNDYLSLYSKTQYELDEEDPIGVSEEQNKKRLIDCFIKFDESLEDITNATINDFQVETTIGNNYCNASSNIINMNYEYFFNDNSYDLETQNLINIEDYYGKKITALGFGNFENIYACLDVSNYDIYVLEGEDLYIARKDIITTEADCYDYDFPVHLSPLGDSINSVYNSGLNDYEPKYAKLYSVGFSKTKGILDEEYVVGEDIDIKIESDTSFGFNLRKGEDVSIYPGNDLYTSESLYPMPFYVKTEIYPQNDLYTSDSLYPSDSNYKYIFFKYRLYLVHWNGVSPREGYFEIKYLDEYYTMYLENNTKGLFEIVEKIERSDD